MADEKPLPPAARLSIGLLCVVAGGVPMLAAFNVGPLGQGDINGPPWLGAAAGGVFVLAGLAVLAGAPAQRSQPFAYLMLFVMLGCFAAIGNWIAFGPGPRQCSVGFTAFMFETRQAAAEVECRVVFGIGAIMLNGILFWMLASGLRKLAGPGRLADVLDKVGTGVFLLALSPILVPMVGFLIGKSAIEAYAEYRRTGKWPRNEAFIARMKRKKDN